VFRNCAYLPREQLMRLYTWDESGKRISIDTTYEPYIYLETTHNPDGMSIYNTKLKKRRFRNQAERAQYLKDNAPPRIFENLGVQQQFLIDYYGIQNEDIDFAKHPLKVYFLDIETYSPDSFPNIQEANHPINIITIYDTLSNKFITWGVKPFAKKLSNVTYVFCKTEKELLQNFLEFFERDYPDILSGWNSEFFDIPYIINRMTRILGEDTVHRLSPIGRVRTRSFMGKFGKTQTRHHLEGLSCVDYLQIYKRFCPVLRETYKLGDIGETELKESKVDYGDTDLASLADDDWDKFVEYNIQDVNLLVKLEQSLQYIQLLRMIAYAGLTTFEGALGSLSVITGLCAIRARARNQHIPTFKKENVNDDGTQNAGAYVSDPQHGFQEHVVSFDANSLYPNVMITLNLSPETKIGTIISNADEENVTIKHVNGNTYQLSKEKFVSFVKQEELAISKAKVLFSQKVKGIIPETVDHYYKKRVEIKKQLSKAKRDQLKLAKNTPEYDKHRQLIDNLNITQHTIKILINTIYGYFGNKHSPLGDDELAESITLTGQAAIKQSNKLLTEYIQKTANLTNEQIVNDNPIIYNDTDSSYISIKHIVKNNNIPITDEKNNISKEYYQVIDDIADYLNEGIQKWGVTSLNSKDCRLNFKREKISDVGLFLQKKRYVLHVLDDEGIPCSKFKYTGVEVVRTTMPAALKVHVKKIIETMLLTKSRQETDKVFTEVYEMFKNFSIPQISSVMGVKDYEKYASLCDGFQVAKGMPIHIKAAYYYNILLERFNIQRKYEKINSGDKMKYFYLRKPNKFGLSVIGYKYDYPKEFEEIFEPDYEKIFEKDIYSVIERFYDTVKWKLKRPSQLTQTDLFDLLSFD